MLRTCPSTQELLQDQGLLGAAHHGLPLTASLRPPAPPIYSQPTKPQKSQTPGHKYQKLCLITRFKQKQGRNCKWKLQELISRFEFLDICQTSETGKKKERNAIRVRTLTTYKMAYRKAWSSGKDGVRSDPPSPPPLPGGCLPVPPPRPGAPVGWGGAGPAAPPQPNRGVTCSS